MSDPTPLFARLLAPLLASLTPTRPGSPSPDRIIIINRHTQSMMMIENISLPKDAHPPASKASIDGLPGFEIKSTEEVDELVSGGKECVICLEEYGVGDVVSEMPCQHKFHGGCVKKWLEVHGSCPVCRFKMPVDADVDVDKNNDGDDSDDDDEGDGRRGVLVRFAFGRVDED